MEPFLGGERAVEAVGDYDGGIKVAGDAGFDKTAAVVQNDDVRHEKAVSLSFC